MARSGSRRLSKSKEVPGPSAGVEDAKKPVMQSMISPDTSRAGSLLCLMVLILSLTEQFMLRKKFQK